VIIATVAAGPTAAYLAPFAVGFWIGFVLDWVTRATKKDRR
jgi:hypothetical protein